MAGAWADVSKNYSVDQETITATETLMHGGYRTFADAPSLEYARTQVMGAVDALDTLTFETETQEMIISAPSPQPPIPVFVHMPKEKVDCPVIVLYFHGGGLIKNTARANQKLCQSLASKSGAIIVDVEYRLLPNKDDPMSPFNDAKTATEWVMANKEAVGGTAGSHVGVAGDSAGGQIACCVSHDVPDIVFQCLLYPVLDVDCEVPSMKRFYSIPIFGGRDMIRMFVEFCFPCVPDAATNPRFNPSANPNLKLLPPTFILNCELDPLLDWALSYEQKLKRAGVSVQSSLYRGLPHGFFTELPLFPNACEKAHVEVAEFIKSFQ